MRAKATVIFDGDCGFCTWCAGKLERWVKPPAIIIPWQHAALDELGVSQTQCESALQWVPREGAPVAGGRAIAALLQASPWPWRVLGASLSLPGLAQLTDRGYEIVAANRHRLPGSTPACDISSR
jgi:predicted DCC family thiol-disulfide oxidoreductase YuxK